MWERSDSFGYTFYETGHYAGPDPDWCNFAVPIYYPTLREMGWPMKSMRSITRYVYRPEDPVEPRHWQLPIAEILRRGPQTCELPGGGHFSNNGRLGLMPIPIGFTVNTLLYGGVVWGGVVGLRRWRRACIPRGFAVISRRGESGVADSSIGNSAHSA